MSEKFFKNDLVGVRYSFIYISLDSIFSADFEKVYIMTFPMSPEVKFGSNGVNIDRNLDFKENTLKPWCNTYKWIAFFLLIPEMSIS